MREAHDVGVGRLGIGGVFGALHGSVRPWPRAKSSSWAQREARHGMLAENVAGAIDGALRALLESFRQMKLSQEESQASGLPAVRHADLGLTNKASSHLEGFWL